jgi:hypothetical protein
MAARPDLPRGSTIDIHELLKREAFDGPPSYGNHFERSRPAPGGVVGCSDQYIILDSFNKLETSRPEQGTFHWDFMVQGVTGDQVIGVRDKVDTVVEMQFGQFYMPAIPKVPYIITGSEPLQLGGGVVLTQNNVNSIPAGMSYGLASKQLTPSGHIHTTPYGSSWAYDPLTQTPNGLFTIQVIEAGLQSISDRGGARHHLDYAIDIPAGTDYSANLGFTNLPYPTYTGWGESGTTAAQAVISTQRALASPQGMPGSAWDTYVFTDPLQDVHGITLQFRGPDVPLSFQPDSYYSIPFITDASSNLCFLAGPEMLNNGTLNIGDRLFVHNFNSGNRTLDSYMNQAAGLVATISPNVSLIPVSSTNPKVLGSEIVPNWPGTPAATAAQGTVAIYFDPNIRLLGATVATKVPNPVTEAQFYEDYFIKYPSQRPNPKSLAPKQPLPVWQSMTASGKIISGSTVVSTGVTVNIAKLRLRIPVRLRRVVQRLTNYMSM